MATYYIWTWLFFFFFEFENITCPLKSSHLPTFVMSLLVNGGTLITSSAEFIIQGNLSLPSNKYKYL